MKNYNVCIVTKQKFSQEFKANSKEEAEKMALKSLEYGEPHIDYSDGWIGEDCKFWTSKIVETK